MLAKFLSDAIDYGIVGLLVILSIIVVAIALERYVFFRRVSIEDYPDIKSLELTLTEKLFVIASVGTNAPYVGLLGTVLGIMLIFYNMGTEAAMDTGKIMAASVPML